MPRQARYIVPRGLPRRGEFLAACLVLAVVAHVLFAQLTIIVAAVFVLVTRMTRWRLSWLAAPGRRRTGLDGGGGPAGRRGRLRRRPGPGGPLPRGQRAPGGPPAALHRRVHRHRLLAAPAAAAGHPHRHRRGGHHRLAELAAHRRTEPAAVPSRPAGGGQARRDQAGHPGWRRGDQGRRLPRHRRGIRRPGRGVLAGDGGRSRGVRLGRARRADRRIPAGPRGHQAAQAGARGGPDRRPGPACPSGRGLRRGGRAAAGVRGRRLLRAVQERRSGPAGRADHGHGQLGRAGQPVPPQLPGLPAGRVRADRRRAG